MDTLPATSSKARTQRIQPESLTRAATRPMARHAHVVSLQPRFCRPSYVIATTPQSPALTSRNATTLGTPGGQPIALRAVQLGFLRRTNTATHC